MKNWPETVTELTAHLRNLRSGAPEVMRAFSSIANAALAAKALDGKTKELIALGISVAIRCDDCIAFHTKAALSKAPVARKCWRRSAWPFMGAGPAVMYATHALDAFTQFENENTLAPV
jgi:AhpD family alkylhydroperoxidase